MIGKSKYAISAGHQSTLEAAKEILDSGGNAIDAAIAAYWTSMVAEPFMSSAGAGGFSMIHDQSKYYALDWFCQTPKQKLPARDIEFFPITVDFGKTTEDFYVGMGSVAVPGAIAMLFDMHERWGTIPMKELVQHACALSKAGSILDPFQAYECELLKVIYELDERGKAIFLDQERKLKKQGDAVRMEQFADFAESIAIEGKALFYQGEIAQSLVSHTQSVGGHLSMQDLDRYEVLWQRPYTYSWAGRQVHSTPMPSVGAMLVASLLHDWQKTTEDLSRAQYEYIHTTVKHIKDIGTDIQAVSQYLLSKGLPLPNNYSSTRKWGGTSHFNIKDANGMAISLSTSIGEGCGYFIPGTDMQMNNMLGEMALLPNGLHSWQEDIRLQSMMSPTMISDERGRLEMMIGSGGAGRIPYAIAQVIYHHLCNELPLQDAIHHPRMVYSDNHLHIEEGFDVSDDLDYTQWPVGNLFFGGTHAISLQKGLSAYGDPRRYGVSFVE